MDRRADERIALPRAAPLFAVEDEGLRRFRVAVLDEDLFYGVLNGLHVGGIALRMCGNECRDLVGKCLRLCEIIPAHRNGSLVDGPGDLLLFERRARTVALDDMRNHCCSSSPMCFAKKYPCVRRTEQACMPAMLRGFGTILYLQVFRLYGCGTVREFHPLTLLRNAEYKIL